MNNSPLNGAIDFLIKALGLGNGSVEQMPGIYTPSQPISDPFPIGPGSSYGILPPILTEPGAGGIIGPFNPIGPYNPGSGASAGAPQDQNTIPDDIRELLG